MDNPAIELDETTLHIGAVSRKFASRCFLNYLLQFDCMKREYALIYELICNAGTEGDDTFFDELVGTAFIKRLVACFCKFDW